MGIPKAIHKPSKKRRIEMKIMSLEFSLSKFQTKKIQHFPSPRTSRNITFCMGSTDLFFFIARGAPKNLVV